MDERFGPRDLVDDATLRMLSRRSDGRGLLQLACHLGSLAVTGYALWQTHDTLWAIATLPLHGAVLIFLFAPLHETIHRTAFRTRRLNDAVAWVAGLVLLLPAAWFRQFHFAHHRWTQDPARDPELNPPRPTTLSRWLWYVSGLPYWIAGFRGLLGRALGGVGDTFVSERDRPAIVAEARTMILAYFAIAAAAAWAGALDMLLWLWILPALVAQPLLRLYLLAEHWGCQTGPDMLRNTRTTRSLAPVRFLAWNMPYHAEHHAFPGVPFHALPRLHGTLRPHLAFLATGYVATTAGVLRNLAGRRPQPSHTGET